MMGEHEEQKDLFSYQVDLDKRVRSTNPLRASRANIDFDSVRDEVRRFYGYNGNVSVDPVIVVKLLFLLFYDNVKSERELMRIVLERLDYLWFLGLRGTKGVSFRFSVKLQSRKDMEGSRSEKRKTRPCWSNPGIGWRRFATTSI